MERGIDGEGPFDKSAGFLDTALVEKMDGEVRVGDRIVGIHFDGAPERRLSLEGCVTFGFQKTDAVPNAGLAGRDRGRLSQLGKRALDVAVDLGAHGRTRHEDVRVVRVDGAGAIERGAHLLAPIGRKGELRRKDGDAGVLREALFDRLHLARRGFEILPEARDVGLGERRRRIVRPEFRLGLDAARLGERGCDIARIDGRRPAGGVEATFGARKQASRLRKTALRSSDQPGDQLRPRLLRPSRAVATRLAKGGGRNCAAVERERRLGERQPVFDLARGRRHGFTPRPRAAQARALQRRRRQPQKSVAQREVEQHLLTVVRADQDELGRRLTDRRDGAFTLVNGDRALRVFQFDDAFEHDEGSLARTVDGKRPIGAANGCDRRRRPDIDAGAAARGTGPDVSSGELELRRTRRRGHLVHDESRVPADPDLGLVREEDRQIADRVGAQGVAAEKVLLLHGGSPVPLAHEAQLLAALRRNDRARWRRRARDRCLREARAGNERKKAAGGEKPRKSR
jgi:hypothetical protein